MKVKILGCSGSEAIGHNPPGFLVNDVVMLDAGTITAALSIQAQSRITDIFISHTHLDHIKSLLFLADNIIGRIKQPVNIRAIPKVIDAIKKHLMNDLIWPDFTKIPTAKNPVLAYKPFPAGVPIAVAGLKVQAIPMNHPVPAVGFMVSDGRSTIIYSADTGPNEALWKVAAKAKNLKAIIVDTSFPNSLDIDRRSERPLHAGAAPCRPHQGQGEEHRADLHLPYQTGAPEKGDQRAAGAGPEEREGTAGREDIQFLKFQISNYKYQISTSVQTRMFETF